MTKKIAVVLCGSGAKDGSEIREAVAVLWSLNRHGAQVQCFAPELEQTDVINALTGQPMPGEKRNMRIEAARIARGEVLPLSQLNPAEHSALVIPGGFGVAKNLCNFASKGGQAQVIPELVRKIQEFHSSHKPLAAICIAPVVLALALKGKNLLLTLGEEGEAAQEIMKLGHRHQACKVNQVCVDTQNRIVTTPAYMIDHAQLHEIFSGIDSLVEEALKLA